MRVLHLTIILHGVLWIVKIFVSGSGGEVHKVTDEFTFRWARDASQVVSGVLFPFHLREKAIGDEGCIAAVLTNAI